MKLEGEDSEYCRCISWIRSSIWGNVPRWWRRRSNAGLDGYICWRDWL